jgi:uncharacterized protein (TIGR03382 family)
MRPHCLLALLGLASSTQAAVFTYTDSATTAIPDGESSGVARSLTANTGGQTITGVEVSMNISATLGGTPFIGDLYLYLTNGSEVAILANRPGRSAAAGAGYSDEQSIDILFSQVAAADFHNYRLTATGSHAIPLSGTLTGVWEADGRITDPASVLDTDARTAGLDVFNGDLADDTWSIFAADLSSGGTHQINSWSISLTVVPEPGTAAFALLSTAALIRRRRPH